MQHQKSNVIGCCDYDGHVSTKLRADSNAPFERKLILQLEISWKIG